MKRSMVFVVLAIAFIGAACGGSDGDSTAKLSESKRTTSTSTSTSTSIDVTTSSLPPVVLSTTTTAKSGATTTTARPSGTTVTSTAPPSTTTTTAPTAKRWSISIKNFAFSPPVLQIHVGDTVTVKNDDGPTHTWTADDGSFDSGNLAPGATFSHAFDKTGTITYHCNIHSSMKGTIQVS